MPKFLFFLGLFVYSLPYTCWAQRIETQRNKVELMDSEVLKVDLKVYSRRSPERPNFPDIPGFRKGDFKEPMRSRGFRRLYTYTQFYFPIKTGPYELAPFPVFVEGKKLFTERLSGKVEVENGRDPDFSSPGLALSLSSQISDSVVKIGQAIQLGLFLNIPKNRLSYISLADVQKLQQNLREQIDPVFFDVEMTQPGKGIQLQESGNSLAQLKLASIYLIPKKAGKFTLGPFEQGIRTRWKNPKAGKGLEEKHLHIKYYEEIFESNTLEIEVNPLPKSKLPLAEIVGKFRIEDSLEKSSFYCGEPIQLLIEIEGEGNLRTIPRLSIDTPEEFLLYDPQSRLEIYSTPSSLKGKKSFLYQLIASKPGEYVLPPLKMYYFNPEIQAFDSTRSDSIYLDIQGEAIPQLLEINILDNFYRQAFAHSQSTPPFVWQFQEIGIIIAFTLIICVLFLSFFQPGFKVFGDYRRKNVMSPGLRKLIENKKR